MKESFCAEMKPFRQGARGFFENGKDLKKLFQ